MSPRTPDGRRKASSGADQVGILGRRSESGWERTSEAVMVPRPPDPRSGGRERSPCPVVSRRLHAPGLDIWESTGHMFTGIVEELGAVRSVDEVGDGRRVVVEATTVLDDVTLGASIAVNGCCLTVVEWADGWFAVDAVPETLDCTTVGGLSPGDPVNLERPLVVGGRFGGHVVQGHVDMVTEVLAVRELSDGSRRLSFRLPDELAGKVVEKGSVTLDGASLTVAAVDNDTFDVALIPHTLQVTTFGRRAPGDQVNVEADVLAHYVAGLLAAGRIPANEGSG